ncbi:hypothetical protein MOBT1_003151 [Malassezia obtusa]|uniref:Protein-tyrosine-phosphatase n=1 Tax=Malassezia obtusa TaxID=76774 RepID=A0AAF0E286_9BASI|nr:hypothetical protein MOBT1_003151 [Malassezia obtusa]
MGRVPLAPPMRFGTVAFPPLTGETESETSSGEVARITTFSECLYRGAYPKQRNLPFLETLHLRTIVSLTPKPLDSDAALASWAREQNGGSGVRLVHVRTEKPKEESGGLTREGAARAMLELLNRENLPLYVHCLDGVETTSTLIACLRKIQAWNDTSLRDELARGLLVAPNRLAGTPYDIPKHLAHFVDHYGDPDGVLVPQRSRIPAWVWPGLAAHEAWLTEGSAFHHPSLRIHFERSEHYIETQRARFGAVWSAAGLPRSRTPSSLSVSDISEVPPYDADDERSSRRHSSDHAPSRRPSVESRSSHLSEEIYPEDTEDAEHHAPPPPTDDPFLRTPRARPVRDESDIPPLATFEPGRVRASGAAERPGMPLPDPERTPLVTAQDAAERARSGHEPIPPIGLSHDAEVDADVEPEVDEAAEDEDEDEDEDDEDDEDDDEDPSQVLDALDLEGY